MGKLSKPTPEELKFVYGLLARGDSDRDILEEYCRLYESGNLKHPFRTDERFVKERRKEFEAATDILSPKIEEKLRERIRAEVKAKQDPVLATARSRHFDDLLDLAAVLVRNVVYVDVFDHPPAKPFDLANEREAEVHWVWHGEKRLNDFAAACACDGPELFESLCRHVRGLLPAYSGWQRAMVSLMNGSRAFYEHVQQEAMKRTGLPDINVQESLPAFAEDPHSGYLDELASEVYLYATGNIARWSGGREDKGLDVIVRGGSGSLAVSWAFGKPTKQRILAEGVKDKMDMVVQVTESMRREYLHCQEVRDLELLASRAKEAATAVEHKLKEPLLRRVFPGKCRLCPGA